MGKKMNIQFEEVQTLNEWLITNPPLGTPQNTHGKEKPQKTAQKNTKN